MKFSLTVAFLALISLVSAQSLTEKDIAGYYRGESGTLVLNADGSARLPSDMADPSADGARWHFSGDAVTVTPFFYSGPREFNNTMDMTPLMFTVQRNGTKIELSKNTYFGRVTFSK